MTKEVNYLIGYKDIFIVQDKEMFKFSLDSVLLPKFATINPTCKNILDIGTGNAPIPLILSKLTKAHILGVEIQIDVFKLAQESIKMNNLNDQIELLNGDINEISNNLPSDFYDLITCNPPYFKVTDNSIYNNSDYKTIARHEVKLNMEQLIKISKKLLKNGGTIDIVIRPERLVEILLLMKQNNIEPKKMQFVYPKKGDEANILLIEGKKNGNPGIKILDSIYTYDDDGNYTKEMMINFN